MLVGDRVKDAKLVTGVIVGALGMETPTGEFEVIDLCYPEMAPQPMETEPEEDKMDVDGRNHPEMSPRLRFYPNFFPLSRSSVQEDSSDEWIAVVSGLDIGSLSPSDAQIQLLTEYLTGEGGTVNDQVSAANISRLIIAGDSLAAIDPIITEGISTIDDKKAVRGHFLLSILYS